MAGLQRIFLIIGPEPPPQTGMEIATLALMNELQRARVSYARINTADPADELGNRAQWTVHNVSFAFRHLLDAVRRSFSRDVGAVYVPIAQSFPALFRDLAFIGVAHLARKPVVLHLHGGAFDSFYREQSRWLKWLLRTLLSRVSLGIVLNERLRPALECVIPAENVTVVQNGIDFSVVRANENRRTSEVSVFFISVLYRWKGVFVFIEAFALAAAQVETLQATVAGQWPSDEVRDEAIALAKALGVSDQLTFAGTVEGQRKVELFAEADIFCFSSLVAEGQPLVILEAMGAGLPVVAPAWPGIAGTVVDGETGLLVSSPSPDLLAEKLVQLARQPTERRRMGAAGRRRYQRLYTQQAFGERLLVALRPVLEQAQIDFRPSSELVSDCQTGNDAGAGVLVDGAGRSHRRENPQER